MDNLANVKGVGEYYSWRYPSPSLASSPTSSRKSSGIDSLRVSSAPVSPLLRPVPIHMSSQPPEPMSECEEGIDSLPDFSNLPSNRWQSPPKVPRPQNHEPAQSSRSQRRSKYRVREAQGPSGSNLEAPIDLAAMRRQSAPSTSTLNPHAPPFMPRDLARPRAYSVPVDSESLRTGLNSSYTSEHRPTEPVMTLNPFHPYLGAVNNISTQRLASIRNDISQLRQWSNQFGPPPLPRLEPGPPAVFLAPHSHSYTHLGQTPLSERPTYPSEGYPIHPPVAYPLFDPGYLPVAPIAYREQQMVNIGPRHLWHTGYVPAPSTIIHPTLLPSLGTNMVNSPFIELTPVELPESRFKSELDNYSAAGTPASSHAPSLEACSQAEATSSFRRRSSPALFERGKSSLTPITERSETTSTSSQRMDLSDDQGLEAHKTPKKKNRRNKKPSSNINARRRMLVPKGTN
ncbi:hypothetical protein PIIN_00095 [Serendipita indica DSM 11827]|uniref:Uncharacterized protein n=1 Tax=Serendipita indica (strain DSM 11827) TaxID=1109443 RepID=G4T4S3_SERID|nr:hypothetical protein PIIN_00095 [Serendipita indica DSM 11827]